MYVGVLNPVLGLVLTLPQRHSGETYLSRPIAKARLPAKQHMGDIYSQGKGHRGIQI
jgi:hypothetical protein